MDLKIEITKLYALHNATIQLEHGIRELGNPRSMWKDFTPSRFVYAFFTFNSIYSFNWPDSFSTIRALSWGEKDKEIIPKEEEQIKSYLKFVFEQLGDKSAELFQRKTIEMLDLFEIRDPVQELEKIDLINAALQKRLDKTCLNFTLLKRPKT